MQLFRDVIVVLATQGWEKILQDGNSIGDDDTDWDDGNSVKLLACC